MNSNKILWITPLGSKLVKITFENVNTRIEGHIVGFDEYMNLVLDDAAEVHLKRGTMKRVGRVMLKGDNITLIQSMDGGKGAQAAGGPAN